MTQFEPTEVYTLHNQGAPVYYSVAAEMMKRAVEELPASVVVRFRETLETALDNQEPLIYNVMAENAHDLVDSMDDIEYLKHLTDQAQLITLLDQLGYSTEAAKLGSEGSISLYNLSFGLTDDGSIVVLEAGF